MDADQKILTAHIKEMRELAQFLILEGQEAGLAWLLLSIIKSEKKLAEGQADGDSDPRPDYS